MVRFKDVTKVVLVLALCFGFAGVCGATVGSANDIYDNEEDIKRARFVCTKARQDHADYQAAEWRGKNKEKDYQKLANANKPYSVSSREANNRDTKRNGEKATEAEKVAVDLCTVVLKIDMYEEAKRKFREQREL
jgi:hypothetical protein